MRLRRLRSTPALRNLVRETSICVHQLIQPFFVIEGINKKQPIDSMPGIFRFSTNLLLKEIENYIRLGGTSGLLFGIPNKKNAMATESYSKNGIISRTVKAIKKEFPDFLVIADICLCAYTHHGHCGIVHGKTIDNDKTLPFLSKAALCYAEAGADIVAPSDMMDFRVRAIRGTLDKNDFKDLPIMSYAVKYASSYYGPFRDALDSTPQFGDRKSYQMDYANKREAVSEALQDAQEGADIIMVKPALAYLDVISEIRRQIYCPVAAYSVSGEYAMIKAAAQKKWIDERNIVEENLTAMRRAGADIIITYHAKDALRWFK